MNEGNDGCQMTGESVAPNLSPLVRDAPPDSPSALQRPLREQLT